MTKEIDDKSRVKLSIGQFWGIIVSVASATFVIAGGLWDIKAEQAKLRSELILYRAQSDSQIQINTKTLAELKAERADALKDWNAWRFNVNEINVRQDSEIRSLQRSLQN